MSIILIIGKQSDNTAFEVDLTGLPHLFVSYSERGQRDGFYFELIRQLRPYIYNKAFLLAYAGTADPKLQEVSAMSTALVLREVDGTLGPIGRTEFLKLLQTELKKRKKHVKKSGDKPLIIFIDDLFETVIQKNKYAGRYFLELLKDGPANNMYMIMASIRTYRNLVYQLIEMIYDSSRTIDSAERTALQQQSAELVITPEDLYFYRTAREPVYVRLFAWNEGEQRTD